MSLPNTLEVPYRSATETLIAQMDEFSRSEPRNIVIIHTNEAGEVVVSGNTGKCAALGIIETAKHMILRGEV